jgi:hypothetical protein
MGKGFCALCAAIAIFFVSAGPGVDRAACAEKEAAMETTRLWPPGLDGWKAEAPAEYTPATAYTYMNGAAELFIAYRMRALTVVRYELPKRPAIILEIYRMGSPEDAYGLFSFESDDPGAGIGQGSEFGGGLLRFWKGPYFVSVYGDGAGEDAEAATLNLGRKIAGAISETGNPPRILSLLPRGIALLPLNQTWFLRSHILLNQRFFIAHKNILNLSGEAEAALGRYGSGAERMHFLLVKYPSEGKADEAYAGFVEAYMPDAKGEPSVRTENGKWTAAKKRGVFIAAVFDAPDKAYALKMIGTAFAPSPEEGK